MLTLFDLGLLDHSGPFLDVVLQAAGDFFRCAGAWFGAELTDGEGTEFLQATAESLHDARLTPEFPVVRSREFRAALSGALADALTGKAMPADALAAVQKSWGKLVEETGPDRIRDSYRRQLGLSEIRTDR